MNPETQKEIVEYLSGFVTAQRLQRMQEVLSLRTRQITVVLEDLFQPHNASAVLRSCDCFGIQDVHIVEGRNKWQTNKEVDMGSSQWLTIHRYNDPATALETCVSKLKKQGFRIAATTPHQDDYHLNDFPLDQPVALLFGTELEGLTEEAIALSDCALRIPMYGFTESFNISVSAALCLYDLTTRLRNSNTHWQLKEEEQFSLLHEWLRNSIRESDKIEESFLEKKQNNV